MDGTGEHHLKWFVMLRRPKITCSSLYKDYKQKKCSNIIGHGSHAKGRLHTGGIGKGKKTKNSNVVDLLSV
jgi:hypothetical protein